MVSMKNIANACGVSVATVSKALNDRNDISEDTKDEIRRAAKEMGYLPNLSARVLKTKRTYNIGVLFVDEARSGLTHDYFSNVLDSFKVAVEERGYDITFLNCNKTRANRMTYLEHTLYRGFDGVFIACIDFYNPEVVDLLKSDIPIVTIDYQFDDRMSVVSDNIKGIEELVTHVYKMGHRKIAYIYGDDSTVTRNRLSSFYKTTEELGLEIPECYLKKAYYRNLEIARKCTLELLRLPDPPTCILYPDDYAAIGGISQIKDEGLRVPEDISVVGYDGIYISAQMDPKLTTIYQDTRTMGKVAAEKLIGLIEKPKTTLIEHIIIEGKLLDRQSVRDLRDSL